jgi:hypothetical protein
MRATGGNHNNPPARGRASFGESVNSGRRRHCENARKSLHKESMLRVERQRETKTNGNGSASAETVLQEAVGLPRMPLPYLEDIMAVASKYPYSALAAMIAIASLIVGTIVTLGVAGFTGAFLMYGELTSTRTKLDSIIEAQAEIKGQVSVIKTIHQATLARQDVMNTLMSKESQEQMNAYDRAHPRYPLPDSSKPNEVKQ